MSVLGDDLDQTAVIEGQKIVVALQVRRKDVGHTHSWTEVGVSSAAGTAGHGYAARPRID